MKVFHLLVPKKLTWSQWVRSHFGHYYPDELVERPDFKDGENILPLVLPGPIRYANHILYKGSLALGLMRTKLDDESMSYKILLDYTEGLRIRKAMPGA